MKTAAPVPGKRLRLAGGKGTACGTSNCGACSWQHLGRSWASDRLSRCSRVGAAAQEWACPSHPGPRASWETEPRPGVPKPPPGSIWLKPVGR